jgi:endoglucanase
VLWVDPNTQAASAARNLAATAPTRTDDVARLTAIASQAQASWVTAGLSATAARSRVSTLSLAAAAQGRMPTFVLYALPHLDCRSAGTSSASGYRAWIDQVLLGLGTRPAIVVLEPDSLAMLGCLSSAQAAERLSLLRYAVDRLRTDPAASVYLDAGHNGWQSSTTMAARLTSAGIASARGFTLNVSNFGWTADEVGYGARISAKLVEPRPFVVDVGRNGIGPSTGALAWCNPPGRALGERPTTTAADPQVDALLWIKPPGESDGVCRPGEPSAGRFWVDYALGLATLSSWANPVPVPATAPPTVP